jgi:hypothetical protein
VAIEPWPLVDQFGQRDIEGVRQARKDGQAWLPPSLLDLGNHHLADAGNAGELLLSQGVSRRFLRSLSASVQSSAILERDLLAGTG